MPIRVLLADDNQNFVSAVEKYLETLPEVTVVGVAEDGRSALTKIALLQPQLVLLDISLPMMSGIEVTQRLKSWPQPPDIVFLSMYDDTGYRTTAKRLGVQDVVCKTNLVNELHPIIERIVFKSFLGEDAC